MKGIPFIIKNNAEFKIKEIKNITDITGFLAIITNIAEIIEFIINNSIIKLFIFNIVFILDKKVLIFKTKIY